MENAELLSDAVTEPTTKPKRGAKKTEAVAVVVPVEPKQEEPVEVAAVVAPVKSTVQAPKQQKPKKYRPPVIPARMPIKTMI
jgi:hypothetical protein